MVVAPSWVRWVVNALWTAVIVTAIAVAVFPNFVAKTGWSWALAALVAFSLAVAAPAVVMQNPMHRLYAAELTGLNRKQRSGVMKALRRGEIPSDSRVLAAAIGVGSTNLAYLRRAARRQSTARWLLPALYIAFAALAFITRDLRRGLLWGGFALFLAANFVWTSRKSRRLTQHVALLRCAAADVPEAASAAAENDSDSMTLPKRRTWVAVPLVVMVGIGFGITAYLSGQVDKQTPDCRTSDSVVDFISAHRDMVDPGLITRDDTSLHKIPGMVGSVASLRTASLHAGYFTPPTQDRRPLHTSGGASTGYPERLGSRCAAGCQPRSPNRLPEHDGSADRRRR